MIYRNPVADPKAEAIQVNILKPAVFTMPYCVLFSIFASRGFAFTIVYKSLLFLLSICVVIDGFIPAYQPSSTPFGRSSKIVYDLILWFWLPTHIALIVWGLFYISGEQHPLLEKASLTIEIGVVTGMFGITVAHELMHRQSYMERAMAEMLMTLCTYAHFCIEHVYGHHTNVATPSDPATARFGEHFYTFLPKVLIGTFRSAWRIEHRKFSRNSHLPVTQHKMIHQILTSVLIYILICSIFGIRGALFFLGQSIVAIVLLELTNYVQHYGLIRAKVSLESYQPIGPYCSWTSNHKLSNYLCFHLGYHSMHHCAPALRFYQLYGNDKNIPQLPAPFIVMCVLALIPPVWHFVMDPRVLAMRCANLKYSPDSRILIRGNLNGFIERSA
jgi:alkane 1-monooxygenase